MGQTHSLMTDVIEVNTLDHGNLISAISHLMNENRISATHFERHCDPEEIAKNALQFLEQIVQEEYKERKYLVKLEKVKDNSEVLVLIKDIGQVSIRSGRGCHRIAVLINTAGYEFILLEHSIKTPKITGKLLYSLEHFLASKSITSMNDLRIMPDIISHALEYVQSHTYIDWGNACINFHGVYPLQIKSGNGFFKFDIHQIQEYITTGFEECLHAQEFIDLQKGCTLNKVLYDLRQPRFRTLAMQEKPLKKAEYMLTHNTKHDRREQRTETGRLEHNTDFLDLKHKRDERLESILQEEIKIMFTKKKMLEDQYENEKSNLVKIEKDLSDINVQITRIQQYHTQMKATLMEQDKRIPKEPFEDEINDQMNFNEKASDHKDANLSFQKTFTLNKLDARELGKLRLKLCGNEGAVKNHLQLGLEKQLIDLTDYYKKHEKDKYWQNSTIQIFNENDSYSIEIGKGKHSILITSVAGETNIAKI